MFYGGKGGDAEDVGWLGGEASWRGHFDNMRERRFCVYEEMS